MLDHAEYVIEYRGMKIGLPTIEKVVEAVRALEREVPVPRSADLAGMESRAERVEFVTSGDALTTAIYSMFREEPKARRPVEIVRALRKRRELKTDATYQRIYGVLRHGDFEKRGGRWMLKGGV